MIIHRGKLRFLFFVLCLMGGIAFLSGSPVFLALALPVLLWIGLSHSLDRAAFHRLRLNPKIHWTYEPEEWLAFWEWNHAHNKKRLFDRRNIAKVLGLASLLGCLAWILGILGNGWAHVYDASIDALSVFEFFSAYFIFNAGFEYWESQGHRRRARRGPSPVYLDSRIAFFNGELLRWGPKRWGIPGTYWTQTTLRRDPFPHLELRLETNDRGRREKIHRIPIPGKRRLEEIEVAGIFH